MTTQAVELLRRREHKVAQALRQVASDGRATYSLQRDLRRLAAALEAPLPPPVVTAPGVACKGCAGPVEPVPVGRPRLHCERCRRPRRRPKSPPNVAPAAA